MLNKAFFERETNISAKVVADSISPQGQRITSLEVELPRIVLAEMNTHNAISKNCSSTRAITLAKAIQQIEENGFEPVYWGEKQSGMSARNELSGDNLALSKLYWNRAKRSAILSVKNLDLFKAHKQIAGRLLEPFQMVKQVLTATDWDNFFNLRIHPDAQPEILMVAYKIYKAMEASEPCLLQAGEWHLPYIVTTHDHKGLVMYVDSLKETHYVEYSLEEAQRISASCCAQVSYRNTDNSLEKADTIFDRLVTADVLHASPFEHLATPMKPTVSSWYESHKDWADYAEGSVNIPEIPTTWEKGITHLRRDGRFGSGNICGWVQYRHLMEGNTCWKYNHEERMKLFN